MCGDITDKNDKEPWLNTETKLLVLPQIFQQNPFWTEKKKSHQSVANPPAGFLCFVASSCSSSLLMK